MATYEVVSKLKRERKKNRVAADGLLADQEALNLGTLFDVPPAEEGSVGKDKFGKEVRLLNIAGDDADSETIILTFQQQVVFQEPSSVPVPGPVVILLEFGTGSGLTRLEFDLPSPVGGPAPNGASGSLATANIFTPLKTNSVSVVVPASSIRAFARNDALTGFLRSGDVFNSTMLNSGSQAVRQTPAQVRVHAAYGKTNHVKQCVRRQYYISAGSPGGVDTTLAAGDSLFIGIPPFARRLWLPRNPVQSIDVFFVDYYGGSSGPLTIPADSYEAVEIPPHTAGLQIRNPAANPSAFSVLSVVFDTQF